MHDDQTPLDEANDIHLDWPGMRDSTLADLELRVGEIDAESSSSDVLLWLDRATAFAAAAKQLREAVTRAAIAWIEANGALRLSDQITFTVGHTRTVRCVDVRDTLHVALTSLNGDLDGVATLLASNAWKHGACRAALPKADFERLFATEMKPKLVRGMSEPPQQLIRVDNRFARSR